MLSASIPFFVRNPLAKSITLVTQFAPSSSGRVRVREKMTGVSADMAPALRVCLNDVTRYGVLPDYETVFNGLKVRVYPNACKIRLRLMRRGLPSGESVLYNRSRERPVFRANSVIPPFALAT